MTDTLFFIEDTLVELPPRTKFATTLKGIEVLDIATRSVNYTNTVRLPWTPVVQKLFGFAWNNKTGATVQYRKLRCKLVQRGIETIQDGICYAQGVDQTGITLAIFENVLDCFSYLDGRKLIDLNLYTSSGWQAADIDTARLATTGILNAVCNYGKPNGVNVYNVNYWLPCFFYADWINGILRKTGLTLSGAILTDTNFTNLVVPYSYDKWAYPTGVNKEYELTAPLAFLTFSFASLFTTDGATYFEAAPTLGGGTTAAWQIVGNELELKSTGRGSERWLTLSAAAAAGINMNITGWAPGALLRVVLEIYHPVYGYSYSQTYDWDDNILSGGAGTPGFYGSTSNTPGTAYSIAIGDGTRIRARVDAVASTAGTTANPGGGACDAGAVTATVPTSIDRTSVQWNLLMPDVFQKDILRDFSVRFGVLYKQVGGTLYLKTLKEILQDTAGAIDWTGKRIDKGDAITYTSTKYGQKTRFIYTKDSGAGIQPDATAGSSFLTVPNTILDPVKDFFTSPFECSLDTFFQVTALANQVYDSTSTSISDFKKKPRLRLGVLRSKGGGDPNMTFNVTARADYKIVNFIYEITAGVQTANFKYYLDRYYAEFGRALTTFRIVTRYYNLTEKDIANFDRFKMIYDQGNYFLVQQIANFIPGTPTKVELFQV